MRNERLTGTGSRLSVWKCFFLLATLPLWAQDLPCGYYEIDGIPGFGDRDMWYASQFWLDEGVSVVDYDGNGVVNVLDLSLVGGCFRDMSHGLLASYYGFENGDPGQNITFPDFNNLPPGTEPVVVNAVTALNEFEGFEGFLNSDMRHQFGAVFEGFLFVPLLRTYTFTATGRRGLRFYLDGTEILSFDGSPGNDTGVRSLDYGLHPVRIEYYTDSASGEISLGWKGGPIIGPIIKTITAEYWYHQSGTIPEFASRPLDMSFDPPSGTKLDISELELDMYALGPNSDLSLFRNGVELLTFDGKYHFSRSLLGGVHEFVFTLTDGDGYTKDFPYRIYRNPSVLDVGLNVNYYAREWSDWPIPSLEGMETFANSSSDTTQIEEINDETIVGGVTLTRNGIVEMEGSRHISQTGNHEFRLEGEGALWINGLQIAAVGYDYATQYQPRGEIYLESGRNAWKVVSGSPYHAPFLRIYESYEGGPESLVPATAFAHNPDVVKLPPSLPSAGSQGRTVSRQAAEYLFLPGETYRDRTNHGYELKPDPRLITRATGGIAYRSPGSLSQPELGVQLARRARETGEISLEVDIVFDEPVDDFNNKQLVSMTDPRYTTFMSVYIRNNDLFFYARDADDDYQLTVNNLITQGQRYHIVAAIAPNAMRVYVNGTLAVENAAVGIDITTWPNLLQFNVGQPYRRTRDPSISDQQFYGTFLVAAAYHGRHINPGAVNANYLANQVLHPSLGALTVTPPVTYPIAGSNQTELDEAFHYLDRLSFGPSPDSVNEFLTLGPAAWLTQQMNPAGIDDSEMEDYLAEGIFDPSHFYRDLVGQTLHRQIRSERQLQEVMTWFWENHFNTLFEKVADLDEELKENERFRENALGNFTDLLLASGMGFPMTVYLDNDSNVVGAPNENYAREIMELHTMGVNRGYTQADIEELARCFTGWTIRDGAFFFNPGLHDYGEKTLLGFTINAGGGITDAMTVINHLIGRQETAEFIAWKLCQVFIADDVVLDPPSPVVAAAATAFTNSSGEIKQTVSAILNHAQFTDAANIGNKVKTPLEFITGLTRKLEAHPVASSMIYHLNRMGMSLWEFADPTGFPEEGVSWIDTNSLLERWNLVNDFTSNRGGAMMTALDLNRFFDRHPVTLYPDILDLFEDVSGHGVTPGGIRAIGESWLTNDNPGGFVLTDEILDTRVRQTLSFYLRLPELNKQ